MSDGKVIIETLLDTHGLEKGLSSVSKVTIASLAGIGTALTALGGTALKVGIDFESAFTGVRKTVDATEEQFA